MAGVRDDILKEVFELKIESSERHRGKPVRMVMSGKELRARLGYDLGAVIRQAYGKKGRERDTAQLRITIRAINRREFLFGK